MAIIVDEPHYTEITENVNLSKYTSFNIGGDARFFANAGSINQLLYILKFAEKNNIDFLILGGGTNLLINDTGFDGIIIKMDINNLKIDYDNRIVEVGAGYDLWALIRLLINKGLGGLENMSGIPGTLGGAVRGNAGAYRTEIKDVVDRVKYLENYNIKELRNKDCLFSYRESIFKKNKNKIIISAKLILEKNDKELLNQISREIIITRKNKQPLEYPNAGSFFKNPVVPNNKVPDIKDLPKWSMNDGFTKLSAGWLIDYCGLKGLRINDVGISEKHALFIVNYGKGKASDIYNLMRIVQEKIKDRYDIELEPEPELIGFD